MRGRFYPNYFRQLMKLEFYKYHGAGNDFILIDNRGGNLNLNSSQIKFLCDRHFGVGADGLMLLGAAVEHDFSMRYFNSDGNESTMCGNGGRCIAAFAKSLWIHKNKFSFEAIDGLHEAEIFNEGSEIFVNLKMVDVDVSNFNVESDFLNTGSPHHLQYVDNIDKVDVYNEGKAIRNSERYSKIKGANVNFIQDCGNFLKIRTYERGVENETLACGTGATAAAISKGIKNNCNSIKVKALGGELIVRFDLIEGNATNIWLYGPTKFVFKGEIEI